MFNRIRVVDNLDWKELMDENLVECNYFHLIENVEYPIHSELICV